MKYAVVSLHDRTYAELGRVTWANKLDYCKRHGYGAFCKTEGFGDNIYYEKLYQLISVLEGNRDLEWVWWIDCDAIVTNYAKRIEDFVDGASHIIMATDFNALNSGSFFVRNSAEGLGWLRDMAAMKNRPEYQPARCLWPEQQPMINTYIKYQRLFRIVPQRAINSNPRFNSPDLLGTPGKWQPGDWIMHAPAMSNAGRIALFAAVEPHIVR
jgi:hypothetical protein